MLFKSRLLLGVILIVYLSIVFNQYQHWIDFGDRTGAYLTGPDNYSSRETIIELQLLTAVLFILPFLIFISKNRDRVYILTFLTIILPILFNPSIMFIFIFNIYALLLLIGLMLAIILTLLWNSKEESGKMIERKPQKD